MTSNSVHEASWRYLGGVLEVSGRCLGGVWELSWRSLGGFMMRVVDVVFALPDMLMIILVTVMMGRGITGMFIALTLVSWVT